MSGLRAPLLVRVRMSARARARVRKAARAEVCVRWAALAEAKTVAHLRARVYVRERVCAYCQSCERASV